MGFGLWGLRFGGWGSDFGVRGSGSRVEGLTGYVCGRRRVPVNDKVNTNSGFTEANLILTNPYIEPMETFNNQIDAKSALIAGPRKALRRSFYLIRRPGQIYYADVPPKQSANGSKNDPVITSSENLLVLSTFFLAPVSAKSSKNAHFTAFWGLFVDTGAITHGCQNW